MNQEYPMDSGDERRESKYMENVNSSFLTINFHTLQMTSHF